MPVQSLLVYKDDLDVYLTGINRNIPLDAQPFAVEKVDLDGDPFSCPPAAGTMMNLLRIHHPSIGTVWVDETVASYQAKVKGIGCCAGSGGGGGNAGSWQYFTGNGSTTTYTLAQAPAGGQVRMFYTGVLRDDMPFTVVGNQITLNFTPASGDGVAFNYDVAGA